MEDAGQDGHRDSERVAARDSEKETAAGIAEAQALKWVVYALVDPRDSLVRYIGCTKAPRSRQAAHENPERTGGTKEKVAWVCELVSRGLKPEFRALATFAELSHAEGFEEQLVAAGHAAGSSLFNRRGSARSSHGHDSTIHTPATELFPAQVLTLRQVEVLGAIAAFMEERSFPPTIRELGDMLAIRSTNGMNDHLKALERKGAITRADQAARSIVITPWGREVLSKLKGGAA